jgi:hypothetical protein
LTEVFIQAVVFCCVCVTQTFHEALAKCWHLFYQDSVLLY